jgi:hypothetical protein
MRSWLDYTGAMDRDAESSVVRTRCLQLGEIVESVSPAPAWTTVKVAPAIIKAPERWLTGRGRGEPVMIDPRSGPMSEARSGSPQLGEPPQEGGHCIG